MFLFDVAITNAYIHANATKEHQGVPPSIGVVGVEQVVLVAMSIEMTSRKMFPYLL